MRRNEILEKKQKVLNKQKTIEKGITLIALVVTIILLLILLGVTISQISGKTGLFERAKNTTRKYSEEQAREKLETVLLGKASVEKYTNPEYEQNEYLDELIKNEIVGADVKGDAAIVDDWVFELDRSVPKIKSSMGKKENLIWPTVTIDEVIYPENYKKNATIKATAIEKENGINKIELWLNGELIDSQNYDNEKKEIIKEYTVKRNGLYIVKAYSVLSANADAKVKDIVMDIKFTPNGNKTYQKEHETRITVEEIEDKVKNLKYQWTNSIIEPDEASFVDMPTCENNEIVKGTGNSQTGKNYLWILLETENGEKNLCGSDEFCFDYTSPSVNLTSAWIVESGQNKLKVSINDAVDLHSGVKDNSAKLYITAENGTKQEKKIDIVNGSGNTIIDNLDIKTLTKLKVELNDNAGNSIEKERETGTKYFIKNGQLVSTPNFTRGDSASLTQASGSVLYSTTTSYKNSWVGFTFPSTIVYKYGIDIISGVRNGECAGIRNL